MMNALMRISFVFAFLLNDVAAQPRPIEGVEILEMVDFKAGIDAGQFDAILDVRTQGEWETIGHIEGATFAENLGSFGITNFLGASPSYFQGCELCSIVVYCRSGSRASNALEVLLNNGFTGNLYNGQGTDEWEAVGYDLVFDVPSVKPPCTLSVEDQCAANDGNDGGNGESPSSSPTFDTNGDGSSSGTTSSPSVAADGDGSSGGPATFSPTAASNEDESTSDSPTASPTPASNSPSWAGLFLTIATLIPSYLALFQ